MMDKSELERLHRRIDALSRQLEAVHGEQMSQRARFDLIVELLQRLLAASPERLAFDALPDDIRRLLNPD